jgi:FkbM family methyltransferase
VYSDRENLRIVHAAVGPSQSPATTAPKSTVTLYKIRDDAVGLPHWANQLASLRYEVIASHRDRIPDIEKWIVAEEVPSRSLAEIVAESGFPRVDLLASDTEGFDYEVVRQIQNLPSLPQFVYYEHLHLSSEEAAECVDFLHRLGYRTSAVNNGDTFAQRASS